jgi:branched-chain amino acid transport system permease protein
VKRERWIPWVLLLLAASLPLWGLRDSYTQGVGVRILMAIALSQSWNVISGIAGQTSFGHAAFFGIGAYGTGLLMGKAGISPWLGMWVAAGLAALVALGLGFACFRLRGTYFALATFAFSLVLEILARHFDQVTGGDVGYSEPLLSSAPAMFQFAKPVAYYYVGLVFVPLFFWITRMILDGKFGRYLEAIRDDQEAAEAIGINPTRLKLEAYALSAVMASLIGTLHVQYALFIDPSTAFGMFQSTAILLPAIIGGVGTLWGPVVGGVFLITLGEVTNAYLGRAIAGADVLVYAAVLVVVMVAMPSGLVGLPALVRRRWRRVATEEARA